MLDETLWEKFLTFNLQAFVVVAIISAWVLFIYAIITFIGAL